MIVSQQPRVDLTYCLNVHPGETAAAQLAAIEQYVLPIRERLAPGERFGLGLRLSAKAAAELAAPASQTIRDAYRRVLAANDLYVFTANAFPFGPFHDASLKEAVYQPDWQTQARRDYTCNVASALAALMPSDAFGSISTVPGSFRPWIQNETHLRAMVHQLAAVADVLSQIQQQGGPELCLAIEPEPNCYIETTDDLLAFFAGPLRDWGASYLVAKGYSPADAEETLTRHIGVCFDTAHQAVQFENLAESLVRIRDAKIRIAKIQLSAALRCAPSQASQASLGQLSDSIYLHQLRAGKKGQRLTDVHFADLPEALASASPALAQADEWRVHYHVPLFARDVLGLSTTADELTGDFAALLREGICPHLEVETYTWGEYAHAVGDHEALIDNLAAELQWARNLLTP